MTGADWQDWRQEHILPDLEVAMNCFGLERLMIGSDWPVCTVAASYSRTMKVVSDFISGYSDAIREKILGGNAARFWRLGA